MLIFQYVTLVIIGTDPCVKGAAEMRSNQHQVTPPTVLRMHNVREQIPFQTPITLPVVSLQQSIMSNFSLTKFSSENVHVLMFLWLIFLTFIRFASFSVCTAGLEMEDGLCLDPNRPRRYKLNKHDTTITTEGAMIGLQVRVRYQEPGGGAESQKT